MQEFFRQMLVNVLVGLTLSTLAQYPVSVSAQTENVRECLTLMGMEKNSKGHPLKMGESLQIRATGECNKAVNDQLGKTDASRGFKLFLDEVHMADLPVNVSETIGQKESTLTFHLIRKSQEDENRKAWNTLLEKQRGSYEMELRVALAVGDKPAWSVSSFWFLIAKGEEVWGTLAVGVVIFLVVYYRLVKNSTALRDAPGGHYSLGKSQMAFWGLLVVLTFAGIWFLTDTMERIPPQVLILIGISGATGLSAIAIGDNKKSTALTERQNEIDKLKQEQQTLEQQKLTAAATFPPVSEVRLGEITSRLDKLSRVAPSTPSAGFWRDICDDGNGMCFHRLQVVIWSIVLGIIFVESVSKAISMPEFSETLLTLLGISNGTYLGFKIPEKA